MVKAPAIGIALFHLLSGCRSGLLDENPSDLGAIVPSDLGATADAGRPRDLASPVDLSGCFTHRLVEVPLTRIELVDSPVYLRYGRIIRLRVVYRMSSCDEPGGIGMSFKAGMLTDDVTITAHLWRPTDGRPECVATQDFAWIMILSDGFVRSNPAIFAHDGALDGIARLTFAVGPKPALGCDLQIALDQPCQLDCECEKVLGGAGKCIPVANDHGVCSLICSNDGECESVNRPHCDDTSTPPMTCRPALNGGGCGHACGHHQSCANGACRSDPRPTDSGPCSCDAECGAARFCAPGGICRIACTVASDCPGNANYCGDRCGYGP